MYYEMRIKLMEYSFLLYIYWDLPSEKARNKFGSQAGKNPTANQMECIAFSTCAENDTTNQVPCIMFFDVRAVTRLVSFTWQHFTFQRSLKLSQVLKLKNMHEKRFVDHDTSVEDYMESLKNKKTKEKTTKCEIAGNVFEKRKEVQNIEPSDGRIMSLQVYFALFQVLRDIWNNILTFFAYFIVKFLAEF